MTIIKEDYVSFEVAKLLKEKEFDAEIDTYYSPKGEFKIWCPNGLKSYLDNKGTETWWWKCIAPTQQMAMRWLREVHNLVVNPVTTSAGTRAYGEWEADIYYRDSGIDATINACGHIYGETYEEACDAGIRYCLKNLI